MATSTFTTANDWFEHVAEAVNCGSDTFQLALSNTAPSGETTDPTTDGNGILANVTEISYTNYSDNNNNDRTLTVSSSSFNLSKGFITEHTSGGFPNYRSLHIYLILFWWFSMVTKPEFHLVDKSRLIEFSCNLLAWEQTKVTLFV